MKKIVIILISLFCANLQLFGQHAHFTTTGTIAFEKRVNMYALIPKLISKDDDAFLTPAFDSYKKSKPQFKVLKSTLSFAGNKSLYTPEEEDLSVNQGYFGTLPLVAQYNTIYSDYNIQTGVFQKKVFGELFLVKDSLRKIRWKITDETREIAGYTCRRANAIIMDSIYVVAFYTTDIPVSGGPESFNGLPGMILGVALPHENVTWFATKVTDMTLTENAVVPPKKGKLIDWLGFRAKLQAAFKGWGPYAAFYSKAFSL